MDQPPQKPKRRWLSYSLRTLLVVVTIFCVVLGYWVHRANRQRAAVKWVEENGGVVNYDFQIDEKDYVINDARPPGPKWLQDFLGKDYFATVVTAGLKHCKVKDVARLAMLGQLRNLPRSQNWWVDCSLIRGFRPVFAVFPGVLRS